MISGYWIEKAWGDSVENASLSDVDVAIQETIEMDEEHGAFWAGHIDYEYALEVHKDLNLFFAWGEREDEQFQIQLRNWDEARSLYQLFFDADFGRLKTEIEARKISDN